MDSTTEAFRAKGHLGVGADADLVVIDPEKVTDQATYLDSTRPSIGIDYVLVDGVFVVREGDIVIDAYPGRGLRAAL
jgi:N-acyl-D-aspartate/D-glutamate deacylase